MDAPQPRMQAMKICGLCGTANEPGNVVCSSCGKNGFLVQRGSRPTATSGISKHVKNIFSSLMLVGIGVYLLVKLGDIRSMLLMGGVAILMGIGLAILSVYMMVKRR